jgi:hypothetical protein
MTRRSAGLLVIGLVFAALLWFGLVPVAADLHAHRRLVPTTLDARVVDGVVLALNVVLLLAIIAVQRRRRGESTR